MTPTDTFVTIDGLPFHYRDWGGPSAGSGQAPSAGSGRRGTQPLVLLHGLASTCRIWDLTAPLLARDARVVAPDQRGHGESAKPDDGYDFETIVADLIGVLDALGMERPVVVGHSWGGNVALETAVRQPERVSGVVLVDGGYVDIAARMTWQECAQRMAPPDLSHLTLDTFVELAEKWMGDVWSPPVEAALLANFEVEDGRIQPRLSRDRHMRILRALWEQRPAELFPRLRCPVLLAPARGRARGREAEWSAAQEEGVSIALGLMPDARGHWFEDSIHDVPLQRPEMVAEVIARFVASLEG